ncbi:MAG: GNAT family N-acetyltransferase [Actinobacteria bacterium]|nr:GNAT family N-acetyltransferase [Actinomycetota bacterium]
MPRQAPAQSPLVALARDGHAERMSSPYPLRTEHLILRPLREQDIDVILAYRNDPEVAALQDWDLPVSRERVERHVAAQTGWVDVLPGEPRQIGIERDGELIGDLYVRLDEHGGVAEIGFTLRTEFQGRGFAYEAASAVVADLIERLGCHRIFGQLSPENVRSAKLLERLGMHVESLAPKSYWCRGAWDDNLVYAMSDAEWRTRPASM